MLEPGWGEERGERYFLLNIFIYGNVSDVHIFCLVLIMLRSRNSEQDKVNYAVSEREDRGAYVTTLTRMTGCTGLQLGSTEL